MGRRPNRVVVGPPPGPCREAKGIVKKQERCSKKRRGLERWQVSQPVNASHPCCDRSRRV